MKTRHLSSAAAAMCAVMASLAPDAARADTLAQVLERELRGVETTLRPLCAPDCGNVALERSAERDSASAQRLTGDFTIVRFDELYMQKLRDRYGETVTFFVMAHEYGHHLDRTEGSPWEHELRADAFGGCALARGGRPLDSSLAWMRHEHFVETLDRVTGDPSTPDAVVRKYIDTHPPWIHRIEASRRGAELCAFESPKLFGFVAALSPAPDEEKANAAVALMALGSSSAARERETQSRSVSLPPTVPRL
jgi:hypothetical protein